MMCTQIRMITMSSKIQRLNRIESSWHGIRFHRSNTVMHTTKNRSRASLFQAKHVQLYGAISYSAYFGLAPPVFPSVTSWAWPSVRSHLSPTPSPPHFMNLKSVQPGKPDTTTHNETQVVKQRAFMNSSLFAVFFCWLDLHHSYDIHWYSMISRFRTYGLLGRVTPQRKQSEAIVWNTTDEKRISYYAQYPPKLDLHHEHGFR